ncbi:Lactyl (2) diphospho-(5')guanosine:7,8-didemethyl-8-hydroxy-5-deazariboflavin 2-phospho-L-lactate transferase [hydrothermal vent metagenome]|uniref:Lactyl (2) diphospho-(5')guanosine:7,8-didemethyl-8-hydroxy-5-deazariboflavin 2-phospho-L-lactate transferase n=1 Tax=hydrothermal vent metagenome TaxID=652676 RepID=A0A3B0V7A8_9ZZZZ
MKVVVLAGGVGGAKLVDGIARILPAEDVTIVVNTGDDFEHLGLTICPDLDTVMYRLATVANDETGWGRAGESWRTIAEVAALGGPDWFRLGDLDLATHLTRTHLLREGETLTAVTQHLCTQLGISVTVLPMSNQPAPTQIQSGDTIYPFQTWFVQKQWQPPVTKVLLPEDVRATRNIIRAFETADIVLIAPSNPFVSIDPILNVYPIRELIMDLPKAVIGVSPIVGGQAVKGPAAKMMQELGLPLASRTIATYYGELIDGFVYDKQDAGTCDDLAVETDCLDTMMHDEADRIRLAEEVLQFATDLLSD